MKLITAENGKDFWKQLDSHLVLDHPRMKVWEDTVQLLNGQKTSYIKFAMGRQGVTLICIQDDKILLQKEYSYPINQFLLQFPGGRINNGETPTDAARRELIEESNLEPQQLTSLSWYYPNNRRSDAKMHVVLAESFTDYTGTPDLEESIESFWVPIDEFRQMIRRGEVQNFAALAAWALYIETKSR